MARLSAEEQVLAETVLIPGPTQSEEDEEGPDGTLEFLRDLGRARREIEDDEP